MCVSCIIAMCTLFFVSCWAMSCWAWSVMKWSGLRLTTVSVFSPCFIFITVSRVFPLQIAFFLGISHFPSAVVFSLFSFFSVFSWFCSFFVPLFSPLFASFVLFSGGVRFLFLRPFVLLFGFVAFVDFWVGFLLVYRCVVLGLAFFCGGWPNPSYKLGN